MGIKNFFLLVVMLVMAAGNSFALSGLDNDEEVSFYTVDGKQLGATKAIDGVASQAVSSASLVIAKIGGQAIKIAVK